MSSTTRTRRPLRAFQSDSALPPSSSHAAGQRYGIDEGLTNRLMGMGMNVRKNVALGYKVTPSSEASQSHPIPAYNPTPTSAPTALSPSPTPSPNTDFPPIFLSTTDALSSARQAIELERALAATARKLKPWKEESKEERRRRGHGREVRAMGDVGFGDEDEQGDDEMMGVASGSGSVNSINSQQTSPSFNTPFDTPFDTDTTTDDDAYFPNSRGTKRSAPAPARHIKRSGPDEDDEDEGEATDVDDEDDRRDGKANTYPSPSNSAQQYLAPPLSTSSSSRPTRRMPTRPSAQTHQLQPQNHHRAPLTSSKSLPYPMTIGGGGMDIDMDMDAGSGSGNGNGGEGMGDLRAWVGRTDF